MPATRYLCKMRLEKNISLKPYNTFGIDVTTKFLIKIASLPDLKEAIDFITENKLPHLILGSGSNFLFTKNFNGVILLNQIAGKEIVNEDNNFVWLKVSGGEIWPQFVDYCVDNNLGGIENLSLIPGTVGAAPIQNIGAYGAEVKEVIASVEVVDLITEEISTFSNNACEFGYRNSIFKTRAKGKYFVLGVTFKLTKNPTPNLNYAPLKKAFNGRNIDSVSIAEVSNVIKQIRKLKLPDPDEMGNAGSFFKNPVVDAAKLNELLNEYPDVPYYAMDGNGFKLAAGWLIEKCDLKGKRAGKVGVHEKQALVIVNYGKATGVQILNLANKIKKTVDDKFGIKLEFEVNVV